MIRLPFLILGIFSVAGIASAQSPAVAPSEVCRATIASVNGRDLEAMAVYTSAEPDWFCISVPASDLKAKAEQRLEIQPDSDTRALLAVATFALQKGGLEAAISAA